MIMSWVWTILVAVSFLCSLGSPGGPSLAAAALEGAQSAVTLCIAMAGSLCLWSGVGRLLEAAGVTGVLARLLAPVLGRLFPSTRRDKALAGALSANVCANLLGLGNAATPLGIRAARGLARGSAASDEMCRLIVLNTASIQLLPSTVAAVRLGLGCAEPFDILPAVWVSSLCSAALGVTMAWGLGKLWRE